MKELTSSDIRSGRLAWSLILITSILIIFYHHGYTRSYNMAGGVTMVRESEAIWDTDILDDIITTSTSTISRVKLALARINADSVVEVVEKTVFDIPSSFVSPVTGKTVSYKGGKTLERTHKITYGEAGVINRLASPDNDGFMKLDNRYLIAVGSRFGTEVGQYIDLVLENGLVIQCIMGDLKADRDTDATNTFTYHSKCCSEFIIDQNTIRSDIYARGNASLKTSLWDSPVVKVVVYDEFYEKAEVNS